MLICFFVNRINYSNIKDKIKGFSEGEQNS